MRPRPLPAVPSPALVCQLAARAAAVALACALALSPAATAGGGPTPEDDAAEEAAAAPAAAPAPAAPPAATAPQAGPLDALAERYVDLALALGEHDADYVDAWIGPPERRKEVAARGWQLPAIATAAAGLHAELAAQAPPAEPLDRLRLSFLRQQTRAMTARIALLQGKHRPFDDESLALYGVVAPRYDAAHFEGLLAQLDPLLPPGEGGIAARLEAYRAGFVVPPDRLDAVFRAAIAACRERTLAHLALPEGESFTVEYVTGKPWSGYNWYQGDYRSIIQVNTDLPIHVDRAVDLACHEGYPGHHVYNLLHEQRLVRERGFVEHQVQPLFAPQGLLMEGSANHGIAMAFTPEERLAFERATLFPLAGLDPATAEGYYRVQAITQQLSHAGNQAARRYLDGEIDAAGAVDWLVRYGLSSPERARQRIGFFDKYRSYVVNYNVGKDLAAAWVDAQAAAGGGTGEARWAAFERLLSEPILTAELLADLPPGVPGAPGSRGGEGGVAFLVRHAEKDVAVPDDPPLATHGRERAARLAELLAGEGITRILATDTRRARDTAAPLAAKLGVELDLYDHRRLAELAAELRARGGVVLVVGHSNTTGELAALLGGDSGGPIPDAEYDRLYRVDLATGATVIRRY
jgi:phosphohistidine phosphatase SixA